MLRKLISRGCVGVFVFAISAVGRTALVGTTTQVAGPFRSGVPFKSPELHAGANGSIPNFGHFDMPGQLIGLSMSKSRAASCTSGGRTSTSMASSILHRKVQPHQMAAATVT